MWHYLCFIVLVKVKDSTEYTGPESYVAEMIKVSAPTGSGGGHMGDSSLCCVLSPAGRRLGTPGLCTLSRDLQKQQTGGPVLVLEEEPQRLGEVGTRCIAGSGAVASSPSIAWRHPRFGLFLMMDGFGWLVGWFLP